MRKQNYDDISVSGVAGDFFYSGNNDNPERLYFLCPCGCGTLAAISLKPSIENGWEFNSNLDKPTARPSILINRGHWHGYLTDGVFTQC